MFFYLATIGTLSLLVMYILTNVAAARHLGRRSPVQLVPAVAGVLIAGFVLYHNVWPVPPVPYQFLPYLVLGWLLAGLALTAVIPRSGPAPGRGSPRPRVIRRRACGRSPAGGS